MIPLRPLALVCACLAVAATARAQSDDAEQKAQACYQRGHAAYEKHDWDTAIREFENGYRNKPSPLFLHDIADAAEHAGQRQKALDHYQLYLQLNPNAADRDVVQQHIDALQRQLAARDSGLAPAPEAVVAQPGASKPSKNRTKIIVAVSVVGAVLVVGAVAVGTVLGGSSSSDYHAWGTLNVTAH